MKITEKEIDRLAELSKLQFNDEDKKAIAGDLDKIIAFIEKLNTVDTENVEPLLFITDEVNVLREDDVKIEVTQKEALKNAPLKDSDYIKIPKVLNK
jgi:aspartyl-tRNA(Asn)/glutamyl-tRNA(Gln) amidotransferase subunit C